MGTWRDIRGFGVVVIGLAVTVACAEKIITSAGGLAAKGENGPRSDGGKSVGPPSMPKSSVPKDAGRVATPKDAERDGAPPTVAGDTGCHFEYLGDWIRCEHAGWPNVEHVDAARDLEDCMALCLKRPDCTAVTDYFYLNEEPPIGCYLYTSTCSAPFSPNFAMEDGGRDYRKVCDGSSSKGSTEPDATLDDSADD